LKKKKEDSAHFVDLGVVQPPLSQTMKVSFLSLLFFCYLSIRFLTWARVLFPCSWLAVLLFEKVRWSNRMDPVKMVSLPQRQTILLHRRRLTPLR
jgi:hypothetical protein